MPGHSANRCPIQQELLRRLLGLLICQLRSAGFEIDEMKRAVCLSYQIYLSKKVLEVRIKLNQKLFLNLEDNSLRIGQRRCQK